MSAESTAQPNNCINSRGIFTTNQITKDNTMELNYPWFN